MYKNKLFHVIILIVFLFSFAFAAKTEQKELRSFNTKTYSRGKGCYETVISALPMHYLDSHGTFREIDKTNDPQKFMKKALQQMINHSIKSLAKSGDDEVNGSQPDAYYELQYRDTSNNLIKEYGKTVDRTFGTFYEFSDLIPKPDDYETNVHEKYRNLVSFDLSGMPYHLLDGAEYETVSMDISLLYSENENEFKVDVQSIKSFDEMQHDSTCYNNIANGNTIDTYDLENLGFNPNISESYNSTTNPLFEDFVDNLENEKSEYNLGLKCNNEDPTDYNDNSVSAEVDGATITVVYHSTLEIHNKEKDGNVIGGKLKVYDLHDGSENTYNSFQSQAIEVDPTHDLEVESIRDDIPSSMHFNSWVSNGYTVDDPLEIVSDFYRESNSEVEYIKGRWQEKDQITINDNGKTVKIKDPWSGPNFQSVNGSYNVFLDNSFSDPGYYTLKIEDAPFFDKWVDETGDANFENAYSREKK